MTDLEAYPSSPENEPPGDYRSELEALAHRMAESIVYESQRGTDLTRQLDESFDRNFRPDVSDLEEHADQLQRATRLYTDSFLNTRERIVCVAGKRHPIPVEPYSFAFSTYNTFGRVPSSSPPPVAPDMNDYVQRTLPLTLGKLGWQTLRLTVDDTLTLIVNRFSETLLARMQIVERSRLAVAQNTPTGLLQISVHTQQSGLRVRYSPAYLLSTGTVLGSPTTRVRGWLKPGTYVFGAEGQRQSLRWDTGEFNVPPDKDIHLTAV